MEEELSKPKGNLKQVIIKNNNDEVIVHHYGNPSAEEIVGMLAVHAANIVELFERDFPEFSHEEIKDYIVQMVELAVDKLAGKGKLQIKEKENESIS